MIKTSDLKKKKILKENIKFPSNWINARGTT